MHLGVVRNKHKLHLPSSFCYPTLKSCILKYLCCPHCGIYYFLIDGTRTLNGLNCADVSLNNIHPYRWNWMPSSPWIRLCRLLPPPQSPSYEVHCYIPHHVTKTEILIFNLMLFLFCCLHLMSKMATESLIGETR